MNIKEKEIFNLKGTIVITDRYENTVVSNTNYVVEAFTAKIAKALVFNTLSTNQVTGFVSLEVVK
jgi:hypothetical protein